MDERVIQSRDRNKSIFLICVITAALGVYILLQFQKPDNTYRQTLVVAGQSAPDFTLRRLNGDMVRLSDYKGKVVFLNIWATWCGPCREEMPSMEKLYQELKDEAFEILAVSIDAQGAKAVAPFMKKYNLSFPALLDIKGKLRRLYNTTGIPESFIIDKNGIIVAKIIGARDWANPEVVGFLKDLARKP